MCQVLENYMFEAVNARVASTFNICLVSVSNPAEAAFNEPCFVIGDFHAVVFSVLCSHTALLSVLCSRTVVFSGLWVSCLVFWDMSGS